MRQLRSAREILLEGEAEDRERLVQAARLLAAALVGETGWSPAHRRRGEAICAGLARGNRPGEAVRTLDDERFREVADEFWRFLEEVLGLSDSDRSRCGIQPTDPRRG